MENHNGHTKWCTNRKHYDEMEDNRQLKLIKQTFEPYLAEYILKFNPVFDTELKFKKVLDELTSGMVVLRKQHVLECMYLIEEFPDYEDRVRICRQKAGIVKSGGYLASTVLGRVLHKLVNNK